MTLPEPVRAFFSYFPLYTHPAIRPLSLYPSKIPTLWISPPRRSSNLSTDVDCLKWQAYLALRGVTDIAVRWDISPEGAIDGKLPNLQVPLPVGKGELLATHSIPAWVNKRLGVAVDSFEGYKDEASRDESYAWIALLEGSVHAALLVSQPQTRTFMSLISPESKTTRSIETLISPPPPPFWGFSSFLPPLGIHVSNAAVEHQYREAIAALSERLGTDKWFLGSETPTSLDAFLFAYLHSLLHAEDNVRIEVTRRINLVAWELKVRKLVSSAFQVMYCSE